MAQQPQFAIFLGDDEFCLGSPLTTPPLLQCWY